MNHESMCSVCSLPWMKLSELHATGGPSSNSTRIGTSRGCRLPARSHCSFCPELSARVPAGGAAPPAGNVMASCMRKFYGSWPEATISAADPLDRRAAAAELVFQPLEAAVEVIDAVDHRLAL